MKRASSFLVLILLQILASIYYVLFSSNSAAFGILIFSMLILWTLVREAYWKIGAAIIFGLFIVSMLFVVNVMFIGFQLFYSFLSLGLMQVLSLLIILLSFVDRKRGGETGQKEQAAHFLSPESQPPAAQKIAVHTYVLAGDAVHRMECSQLAGIHEDKKSILGSRNYAMRYKPCLACNPFQI